MNKMSFYRRIVMVLIVMAVALTSCNSFSSNTVVPQPVPEPVITDNSTTEMPSSSPSSLTVETVGTPTITVNPVTPVPQPVPEAALVGWAADPVLRWTTVMTAFFEYALPFSQELAQLDETAQAVKIKEMWKDFGNMKLQFGASQFVIQDVLKGFSADDMSKIWEALKIIEDPNFDVVGGASMAAMATLRLRGCTTNCRTIFIALWYACAHLASGENWFYIPESIMSNHPEPYLCNRQFNWEYLIDILEDNCPRYRVEWRGDGVKVTELQRRPRGGTQVDFSFLPRLKADPAMVAVLTVVTAVVVVGFIVVAPESAPLLIPILLVR